jgi:hypothetical protein
VGGNVGRPAGVGRTNLGWIRLSWDPGLGIFGDQWWRSALNRVQEQSYRPSRASIVPVIAANAYHLQCLPPPSQDFPEARGALLLYYAAALSTASIVALLFDAMCSWRRAPVKQRKHDGSPVLVPTVCTRHKCGRALRQRACSRFPHCREAPHAVRLALAHATRWRTKVRTFARVRLFARV